MDSLTPKKLHDQLLRSAPSLLILRDPVAPPKPAAGQPGSATDYVAPTPEIFIAVVPHEERVKVWAFNGHVDLGTGIRTALAQIVAEEMDVAFSDVEMVLGHTEAAPNQGPTIASASIQISAVPLRRAAAQARAYLLARAAHLWQVPVTDLEVEDGEVFYTSAGDGVGHQRMRYGELLEQHQAHLKLELSDAVVALKPASQYRKVGQPLPRLDIPAKVTGVLTFVHDVRMPGMRHGRVVRPPYAGLDGGDFVGRSLLSVDTHSVAHLPGNVQVVVKGDFVGVVADREEQAMAAMRALKVRWKPVPTAPDLTDVEQAICTRPAQPRVLVQAPSDTPLHPGGPGAVQLQRSYVWPYQLHASIGPSCAVAAFEGGKLTVWSGTQNPHMLRTDLNRLIELGEGNIEIVRMEAAGCYGRNCADDVCADAALLAMAVGAPVRVQLTRAQEHQWEPKGTGQVIQVTGSVDDQGHLAGYAMDIRYPSNDAPLLALLLTGQIEAQPRTLEMGDRTAVPPYRYARQHIVCHDMPPLVRSSWIRGVSALPNSFAHESMVDELATAVGQDSVVFRLAHLDDVRAYELLQATAQRAQWRVGAQGSRGVVAADGLLHGRGVAYARYVHSRFPGFGAAWAAWVIDLTVHPETGHIAVQRIVVGQDTGMMVNPAGVRHQIHGNVLQTLSRSLYEQVAFNQQGVASREWGTYPILGFQEVPEIDVLLMDRQDQPPMGGGESASVPGPAAIANALFDATGQRFYAAPFTAEVVRQHIRPLVMAA
ncbi:molybdopterin cofactor-binding domain-containing protein [Comamonas kerstersii]|uniref:xanthine dehydrogenase family protein molybdopterin-binding subunit n=1 Tax=Comamonas kerstersii TaxID=225992 RepID=UPI003A8DF45A